MFHIFVQAFTISKILTFSISNLEKFAQGHVLQYSQWHHSMANISRLKVIALVFYASSHHFWDIIMSDVWPWNLGHCHNTIHHAKWCCLMVIINIKVIIHILALALIVSGIETIQIFYLDNLCDGNWVQHSQWFDAKYQPL